MKFISDEAISYGDVAILTQYSDLNSRSDVVLDSEGYSYPFVGSPMYHVGTKDMYQFFLGCDMPFILHRYFPTVEDQIETAKEYTNDLIYYSPKHLFMAVGSNKKWINKLILAGFKSFCVDMANGNSMQAVEAVKYIKEYCPEATIIAGNIESYDGFARLYDAGARYFRVGIGSGSICSTNINTGYGLPILTALSNIDRDRSLSEREDSFLIADGGIRTAGDVAKALALGASFVMCGKLFASTNLAKGPFYDGSYNKLENLYTDMHYQGVEYESQIAYVQYAGMASKMMREMAGGSQKTNVSEEGHGGLVEYAGQTKDMFAKVCQNLRAVLAYSGCRNIDEFRKECILQRVSAGGKFEKQIHLDKIYR